MIVAMFVEDYCAKHKQQLKQPIKLSGPGCRLSSLAQATTDAAMPVGDLLADLPSGSRKTDESL
jgi:hypothetical protein